VDLDSRVYTIQELKSMARRGARTVKEILEVGVLLAGDRGVIEELSRSLYRSNS